MCRWRGSQSQGVTQMCWWMRALTHPGRLTVAHSVLTETTKNELQEGKTPANENNKDRQRLKAEMQQLFTACVRIEMNRVSTPVQLLLSKVDSGLWSGLYTLQILSFFLLLGNCHDYQTANCHDVCILNSLTCGVCFTVLQVQCREKQREVIYDTLHHSEVLIIPSDLMAVCLRPPLRVDVVRIIPAPSSPESLCS